MYTLLKHLAQGDAYQSHYLEHTHC